MNCVLASSHRMLPVAVVVFMYVSMATEVQAEDQRPNFVVIVADDVSWDDLGPYGHPTIRTPHLNALAEQGMRFEQAFLTCSSCSPSRASLLTGRYPHQTGAAELHMPLPAKQVTIAQLLQAAGYFTAAAGKWHLGPDARRDFHLILGGGPSGCEQWQETLARCPEDRPFFLWLASFDAHREYQAGTIEQPHAPEDAVVPPYLPNVPAVRADLARYYDEITRLDSYVGRIVEQLEQRKLSDNTVVFFLADNGRPFPRCKTTLYDSGIRTPLLVRWPGKIPTNSVCQELVSAVDLAPTLLDLAELPEAETMVGRSFEALLLNPRSPGRAAVFAEHNWHDYQAHERAVRTRRYLYIRNVFPELTGSPPADAVRSPTFAAMQQMHEAEELPERQRTCFVAPRAAEELYDMYSDPHCLANLIDDPQLESKRQELSAALDQWIAETDDRIPDMPTPDRFDRHSGQPLEPRD